MKTIRLNNGALFDIYTPSELSGQIGCLSSDDIDRFNPNNPDENFIYSCMGSMRFGQEIRNSELMRRTRLARLAESRVFGAFSNSLGRRDPATPTDLIEHDLVREEIYRINLSIACAQQERESPMGSWQVSAA